MPAQQTSFMQLWPLILGMLVVMAMFYYTLIVPAKRNQKAHQSLVDTVKEGEEVITAGGIYGKITRLRDEWVELEVAPGTRIKFDRRAIRRRAGKQG